MFEAFTGMPAESVRLVESVKSEILVEIGTLDAIEIDAGIIRFQGRPPIFAVSPDGRKIVFLGAPALPAGSRGQRVKAVCYTTKRVGRVLHYRHAFREDCAPIMRQRGERITFAGGKYQFRDTGINDMPRG